ncbi:RhoGAP-domain-containing protein [Phlegmacium glaucopus]|nr:RhoGAP-domain-containing protein [Phlegmacium glaucopus]
MSSLNGHHAFGGPHPGGPSSFHPGAYSNISSLSPLRHPSQNMGSSNSKSAPSSAPPSISSSSSAFKAAVAGSIKIKRVFTTKKKQDHPFLKSAEHDSPLPLSSSVSSSSAPTQLLNKTGKTSVLNHSSSPLPPPTPPKHLPSPLHTEQSRAIQPLNRTSVIPISPGISPAVNYMLQQQTVAAVSMIPVTTKPLPQPQQSVPAAKEIREKEPDKVKLGATTDNMPDKKETKETWRKSDSTNSHHTVRPGGAGGSTRSSRPVSWAESFQSTHTIVQVSNKSLSALITDANFGMPEEDDDDESFVSVSDSHPSKSTPPSVKVINRRSVSLNMGMPPTIGKTPVSPLLGPSVTEPKLMSHSTSKGISLSTNTQLTTSAPTHPASASSTSVGSQQSQSPTTSNIRGRFAAWTTATTNSSSDNVSRQERTLPALPSPRQHSISQYVTGGDGTSPTSSTPAATFRQTAISMTASGLGPAAAGLAKRAVEKMGRKWGMGLSPSTSGSGSGYSSSSSSMNGPSSFSSASHTDYGLVRTSSNQSTPSVHSHIVKSSHSHGSVVGFVGGGGKRRTPDAPSGAYSVHSTASTSDHDPFASSGPSLGILLRGGLRSKNGVPVTGGVVFGRELRMVTRETAVNVGKGMGSAGVEGGKKEGLILELEGRLVPAIVVRCAQHLLIWGVQEEGLFRVNGRPFHVSKLRSEFDSGVDYDMTECSPGDLDPHAVASVFKAYLRELPESILTQALSPFFDAAIKKEASSNFPEHTRVSGAGRENNGKPGLPQGGPRSGFAVRKPPSLTTLAMPTFSGIPPPSASLVAEIRSLISQLPQENYDLLRTVVDLIKATGKESKQTKMPLSNLLLVFCPSLNMTPPLLKVFCEAEDIWAGGSEKEAEAKDSPPPPPLPMKDVVAKQEEAEMTDISETDDEEEDEGEEEKSLTSSGRASLDTTDDPSSGYHASEEEEASLFEEGQVVRRRWASERNTERSEIPTVYLDTRSHYSSSSASSLREPLESPGPRHHMDSKDGIVTADDGESISSPSGLVHLVPPTSSPSPPLCSSSVESVATPTSEPSSSFSQLPVWDDGSDEKKIELVEIVDSNSMPMLSPATTATPTMKAAPIKETLVQFPQLPNASPVRQARRISIPFLSLPNLSPTSLASFGDVDRLRDDDSPCPSPTSANMLAKRLKRPSLRLLFSKNKKSESSLNSVGEHSVGSGNGMPFISGPILPHHLQGPNSSIWESGTSDSSDSAPLSAVTAPSGMSSRSHLPPVLDTPIEDPSFSFEFDVSPPETAMPLKGMREQQELAKVSVNVGVASPTPTPTTATTWTATATNSIPVKAEGKNLEEAPPQTPIASVSIVSPPSPSSPIIRSDPTLLTNPRHSPSASSVSTPSESSLETQSLISAPSPQLSLLDHGEEDGEDWTRSVLSAADGLS